MSTKQVPASFSETAFHIFQTYPAEKVLPLICSRVNGDTSIVVKQLDSSVLNVL